MTLPYITIESFEKNVYNQFSSDTNCPKCEAQDILIVWDGARCGLIGMGVRGIIGSTIAKVVNYGFNPSYLYYFLKTQYAIINKRPRGVGIPHVDPELFWNIHIPIPPLQEQHRIVAKIEELFTQLDAGIASLKKAQVQLKHYRQAFLKSAFEGKLTQEWREQHKDEIEPGNVDILRDLTPHQERKRKTRSVKLLPVVTDVTLTLPKSWSVVRLGQVVSIIDYRGRTPPFEEQGFIPHLRSSNIKNGKILWENLAYVTEEVYNKYMTRGLPKKSDLLFTTEAPLGEVAPAPDKKFSLAQRIMIIRAFEQVLTPKFLQYQITSDLFQSQLHRRGTGTTVMGVSSRNFQQLILRLPPLKEQYKIVEKIEYHLSIADQIEKILDNNLKQAESLHKSILKKAFEGKLVPQNPSDEPASVFLERIKVEKAQLQPKIRKNRKFIKVNQARLITNGE